MFGRFFQADDIDDKGNDSSPASRLVEAAIPVVQEAVSKFGDVAEALVCDDLETVSTPPSKSGWGFW